MKNQFPTSTPTLPSSTLNSKTKDLYPKSPKNSYFKPFKAIIQDPPIDQPPYIIQTNKQLNKMKERLQKLVEQTDQLSHCKRRYPGERNIMNKYTDIKGKESKALVGERIGKPQRNQEIFRSQTPQNEDSKRYIGFSLEPLQKINHKNSRKSSPKEDEKKATQTKSCLSIFSLSENFDLKENTTEPLLKENYSLGPNEFVNEPSYEHQRRKSMLEFQPDNLLESRYSQEKSCYSHVEEYAEYPSPISSKVQMICLEQQNKKLHEEVENLNKSRKYYQQQLISGLKKDEKVQKKHRNDLQKEKEKHNRRVEEYEKKLSQKDNLVRQLMNKIIKMEDNSTEKLICKIEQMNAENQNLKGALLEKDDEVQTLQTKLKEQQSENMVLKMEVDRLQSSVLSLQSVKKECLSSKTPKFDQTLKIQLTEIAQLKSEISSLQDINERLKAEIAQKIKDETELKNQHRIQVMKESILRKNLQTKYAIQETKQDNVIKNMNNKMKTLEEKIRSNEVEIKEKNEFLKKFIEGRVNMDAESVISQFEGKLIQQRESDNEKKKKIDDLEKIIKLYEQCVAVNQS